MATTKSGFISFLSGAATVLKAVAGVAADDTARRLGGSRLDNPTVDLAKAGYAKNGSARFVLSGTTVKSPDLTNLATNADSYDGDTAFATWSQVTLYNDGTHDLAVASGASNGLSQAGSVTLKPGDYVIWKRALAVTVDATHKTLDITPTSGGSLVVMVGGA